MDMRDGACELCSLHATQRERHHLVPRAILKRRRRRRKQDPRDAHTPCAWLCHTCHRMLHYFLDNGTLDDAYDSIAKLRQHPELTRYLAWRKAHPNSTRAPRTARKNP